MRVHAQGPHALACCRATFTCCLLVPTITTCVSASTEDQSTRLNLSPKPWSLNVDEIAHSDVAAADEEQHAHLERKR